MGGMKAAILFQSLSGNTRRAGELIAANLQQEGWGITTVAPMKQLEMSASSADMVIIGTWVHGLFVVGQAPWGHRRHQPPAGVARQAGSHLLHVRR